MGLVQLPALDEYWRRDEYLRYTPISDRISRSCFREISRYLHFVDNGQIPQPGEPRYHKLGKVRPVLEALQSRFLSSYNPHCEQSIDEAMIKFQGRSTLKQYLPAKPTKRGIKVWCRADAHNGYLCEFQVHTGRAESSEMKQESSLTSPRSSKGSIIISSSIISSARSLFCALSFQMACTVVVQHVRHTRTSLHH